MTRALRFALAGLGVAAAAAPAQRGARLEMTLPTAAEAPLVRAVGIISDRRMRDLLRNGFPARLHFRVELWSESGWFNELLRSHEWDVIVQYDALSRSYRVARIAERPDPVGTFQEFVEVEGSLAEPYRVPINPPTRRGRYYYHVTLDAETLSLSDLDEVERWLRGELRPAVRGKRNPGTALSRGLQTLFLRLLGGEQRRYEGQSRIFSIP